MLLAYSASYAQSNLNFSIETENEDSYAVLSGYTPETETELTIPNKVTIEDKEYEVKKIAASCFSQAKNLTKVTIPNTIVSIESNAFEDCSNIKEFIFEDESNLDFIGDNAFKNCSKVESFTIPAKVTKLGLYAFDGCDNLSEVTCLAETPPSVGFSFLVRDHNNLTKEILIYVPENSIENYDEKWNRLTFDRYYYFIPIGNKAKFITMANGDKYIINETTEKATLRYPAFSEAKQISIPSSIYFGGKTYPVTEIASCSFENAFVETIELPSTIETISSKAFWCKNLTLLICHEDMQRSIRGEAANMAGMCSFWLGDQEEANAWYQKAYDMGDVYCLINLGNGALQQRPPQPEEAIHYLKEAWERGEEIFEDQVKGDIASQISAGYRMKKDWMNTFHWANQAAALDNETGMIDLGMMHLYGNGTPVNHDEGLRWLVKAYEKKGPQAKDVANYLGIFFQEIGDNKLQ